MSYNADLQAKNARIQALIDKANTLPDADSGIELPTLTAPATASDLRSGKQLIGQDGSIVEGAMPAAKITTLVNVSTDGLIRVQAAPTVVGYADETLYSERTKQLDVQLETTFTPGTADQTIASGKYLTGVQTIKGDANLLPENIVSGKTIFGVAGTAETGGGGGASVSIAHLYFEALTGLNADIAFEDGMTWQQYIDSTYNVTATSTTTSKAGFKASGSYVMSNVFAYYMVSTDGTSSGQVKLTDAIEAGRIYQYYNDD